MLHFWCPSLPAAIAFHADHLNQLPAPTDQFGQRLRFKRCHRPRFGTNAFGEQGDRLRIERVGLGQASGYPRKIPDLTRVDDG